MGATSTEENVMHVFFLLCVLLITNAVHAGGALWIEELGSKNGSSTTVWIEHELSSSIGVYAAGTRDSDGYAAAYGGPTWKPFEWLELGIGIGRENRPYAVRRNAFVSIEKDSISGFVSLESGSSGRWYKAHATHIIQSVGVGIHSEAGFGTGPRIEYTPVKNMQIWGALPYLHGRPNPLVAMNITIPF